MGWLNFIMIRGFFKPFAMRVRWKLHLSVILLVLSLIGNAVVLVRSHVQTTHAFAQIRLTEKSVGNIFEAGIFLRDYMLSNSDRAARQWREAHRRLGEGLDEIAAYPAADEGDRLIIRRLQENYQILGHLFERLASGRQSPGPSGDESEALLEQGLTMRANIMIADAYKLAASGNAKIARERRIFVGMLGLSVLVSALAGLSILLVNRRILVALAAFQAGSGRFGTREAGAPIELGGNDEFSSLAQTMNAMSAQIGRDHQALQASEERYLLLFERSPQPILVYDENNLAILAVNDRALELYGHGRDDFATMTLGDICPVQDLPMNANTQTRGERRHRKKNGTIIDVEVQSTPLVYDGKRARMLLVQDITERKRADARIAEATRLLDAQTSELKRANQDLEQFAYVVSHDLRQPLRMVSSYMTLLERRLNALFEGGIDADCRDYIGFARGGATRMDRLIIDLLDYSRIGRVGTDLERIDLTEAANQAAADLRFGIADAKGRVEIGPLPTVLGDRAEIERLFRNLIENALKYRAADRSPVITITAENTAPTWTVTVADNGIGIDPGYFDKIFGIFQRLHGPGEFEGTGIGLASCKKIVEHHGGQIGVTSVLGQGSAFFFSLPVAEAV